MSKLDERGLAVLIEEIDKSINTKINGMGSGGDVDLSNYVTKEEISVLEKSVLELKKTDGELANLKTTNKTNLVSAINELFQCANNGKETIANAIGTPLVDSDTFANMASKIDELLAKLRENLKEKGQSPKNTDKLKALIEMIPNINQLEVEGVAKLPSWYTPTFLDTWITASDMTTSRTFATSSTVDNNIYVIGGYNDSKLFLDTNECYNPTSNTWTTKRNMVAVRSALTSSTVDNKIYVIGGQDINKNINANNYYDPTSNTWTTKRSMPTARSGLISSVASDNIYVIGGYDKAFRVCDINECYNPTSNTWTTKANMPVSLANLTSSTVDNKIYVIGGDEDYDGVHNYYNTNNCYNPTSNTWTTKANMPVKLGELTSSVVDNKIYVIGGWSYNDYDSYQIMNINNCYDPTSNTWTTRRGMPTVRSGTISSVASDNIYVIGGYDFYSIDTSINEVYIV